MAGIRYFQGEDLRKHWAEDMPISFGKKTYRVGKMSYGDYFFEPGKPKGETEPFNNGTLWLQKRLVGKRPLYYVAWILPRH